MKVKLSSSPKPALVAQKSEHQQDIPIPPIISNIASRLAWISACDESDVVDALSRPFHHQAVTDEDLALLCGKFPFMASLTSPMTLPDYIIQLVAIWLRIDALYRCGVVMPEKITQGLIDKTTTAQQHGCHYQDYLLTVLLNSR